MSEKLRALFWPRMGLSRSFQYLRKRVMRLTASPHAIAAGFVAGVAASWTPFIGFHFLLAFAIAYVIAGNMIAAALGTAFGNPLTFPFIWAVTWKLGHFMLGHGMQDGSVDLVALFEKLELSQLWDPVLKPMLVGAVPLAAASGLVLYIVIFYMVRGYQAGRRERLADRARVRVVTNEAGATTSRAASMTAESSQ